MRLIHTTLALRRKSLSLMDGPENGIQGFSPLLKWCVSNLAMVTHRVSDLG